MRKKIMMMLLAMMIGTVSVISGVASAYSATMYIDLGSTVTVTNIKVDSATQFNATISYYKATGEPAGSTATSGSVYGITANVGSVPMRYIKVVASSGSWDTLTYSTNGGSSYNTTGAPSSTNMIPAWDSTPPANPTNFVVTNVTATTISVQWTKATDSDFASTKVYQGATLKTSSSGTTYTYTGLSPSTTYTLKVASADTTGNISTGVTLTQRTLDPPDTTAPDAPVLSGTPGATSIALTWTAPTATDVTGYNVYQGTTKLNTSLLTARSFTVSGLAESTAYKFKVTAVDGAANESQYSNEVNITTLDVTAPGAPSGLIGTAGFESASLTWVPSGSGDVSGYFVYRDGVKQNSTPITGNTYSQTGLDNGKAYAYKVTAVDAAGNESSASNTVNVTPKSAPMDITLSPNGNSIIVSISYGKAPYTITWDGDSETGVTKDIYYILGLTKSTSYTVTVTDADGQTATKTVNTGTKVSVLPPVMPDSQSLFQTLVDSFGRAGAIAVAVIGGAVALGLLVILAMWAWRLVKKWLASSK